jgi:endonuclease/exonuclease/phosphatase family metal-dependent hydrolase
LIDYHSPMPHPTGTVAGCIGSLLTILCAGATDLAASDPCEPMAVVQSALTTSDRPPAPDRLTIATLNIAGDPRVGDSLTAWARERAFDVLLLQEVGNRHHDGEPFVTALSARLGFGFAYAPAQRLGNRETQGLAILSRHRLDDVRVYLLTYHRLRFRSRCRIALAATVTMGDDAVRVMNVHLDTRINSRERLAQLAPLLDALDDATRPQIIGGDFNTMNVRWLRTMWPLPFLQRQGAAVRTRLEAKGFHTPLTAGRPTFRFLGLPLGLDWLYLKDLQTVEWNVDAVEFTDHRGVWARLQSSSASAGRP